MKPWLAELEQHGDRWQPLPAAMIQVMMRLVSQPVEYQVVSECAGCGRRAAQLRSCSACKAAKYCRY